MSSEIVHGGWKISKGEHYPAGTRYFDGNIYENIDLSSPRGFCFKWLRTGEGQAWKKDWDQRYPPNFSAGGAWARWWEPRMRRENMELKNYAITARVALQENDEANGTVAIEGFLTFSVMAEDFEKAVIDAGDLLPLDEFELTGVEEILT